MISLKINILTFKWDLGYDRNKRNRIFQVKNELILIWMRMKSINSVF